MHICSVFSLCVHRLYSENTGWRVQQGFSTWDKFPHSSSNISTIGSPCWQNAQLFRPQEAVINVGFHHSNLTWVAWPLTLGPSWKGKCLCHEEGIIKHLNKEILQELFMYCDGNLLCFPEIKLLTESNEAPGLHLYFHNRLTYLIYSFIDFFK